MLPQVTNFNSVIADCTVGVPCTRTMGVQNGGSAPFVWSVDGLPLGMDFRSGSGITSSNVNPTQVELFGTPVTAGAFNVTLTVRDATGVTASRTFPLNVSVMMTTNNLPNGTIEFPYSSRLRVIGGTPGYTMSQTGGQLPNGLVANASTLTVSGTPHESGGFGPTLTFVDSANHTLQTSSFFSIFGVLNKININTGSDFGSFTPGNGFSRQLTASTFACCATGLTWTLIDGALPSGISLTSGGLLSGTLTTAGVYNFLIRAADAGDANTFSARQFTLNVSPLGLSTSTSLPFGNVGTPYSTPLVVTGATGSVTWTVAAFNYLPPGLSLVPTPGGGTSIAGTPAAPGFFGFTLLAADAGGHTLSRGFTVSIYPAGTYPPLTWFFGPNFGPFQVGNLTLQLSGVGGGLAPYHYSLTPGAETIPGMRVQDGQPLPTNFPLSTTGGFIGLITAPGIYHTSIRVTDSLGNTIDRAIALTISPLHILSQFNLPKATRNTAYSFTLAPYPRPAPTRGARRICPRA